MEGFRFCKDNKSDKWFWRIGAILIGTGIATILIGVGITIAFLYSHLAWHV